MRNRKTCQKPKRDGRGLARTPAKKHAARARFRRAALKAFLGYLLAENESLLDRPELQKPLDDLTALLVMRKVTQLGLAPEAVR